MSSWLSRLVGRFEKKEWSNEGMVPPETVEEEEEEETQPKPKPSPSIVWRMMAGMTPTERAIAKTVAKSLPRGGTVVMVDVAKKVGVSGSIASTTIAKLVMSGIIMNKASGVAGTRIEVLDLTAWWDVAHYDSYTGRL